MLPDSFSISVSKSASHRRLQAWASPAVSLRLVDYSQCGNMSVPAWEHVSPSVGTFLPLLAAYCSNKWRLLKNKEWLLRNKRRLSKDLTCFLGK